MPKAISRRERSDTYRPTSDDWYPNCYDGTVKVSFIELSSQQWRVCVWGDDDMGMERDYPSDERDQAYSLYLRLVGCSDVTKALCRESGMAYA